MKGPKGEITKSLAHLPVDLVRKAGKKASDVLSVEMWFGNYKQKACVKTAASLVRNMVNGVTRGFRYKMRLVAAHFPIKCIPAGDKKSVEFKNFLGGKQDKLVPMQPGCTVSLSATVKDCVIIDGIDNAAVSLTCALINQCVNVGNKDV